MSAELEALLESECSLGTYESTGVFTLSLQEARRKLSHFQLASLEFALLKFIQALVQLGSQAIWIESKEDSFTLNWGDSQDLLDPEHLSHHLEQVMLGPAGPAKDMAIALAAFLDREPAEMWWGYWESQKTVQMVNLFGSGQQAQMLPPFGLYRRIHSLRVVGATQSLALERTTIAKRTLFCPVPILWNGRLMCELSWSPPGYVGGQTTYWADFYFCQDGPPARGLALKPIGPCKSLALFSEPSQRRYFAENSRGFVSWRRYIHGRGTCPLRFTGRRPQAKALSEALATQREVELETHLGESMWVVSGGAYAPSVLLCVKHGVLLNPCRFPLPISGMVVVTATPDLEVDLSQFSAMESTQAWREVLEVIHSRAALVVKALEDDSSLLLRESSELAPMTAGVSIVGGVAGALAHSVFPAGLLVGAAAAAIYFKYAEYQHESRLRLLRSLVAKK